MHDATAANAVKMEIIKKNTSFLVGLYHQVENRTRAHEKAPAGSRRQRNERCVRKLHRKADLEERFPKRSEPDKALSEISFYNCGIIIRTAETTGRRRNDKRFHR